MGVIDEYYQLLFRGNRLYSEYARLSGTSVQELFLMRLLLGSEEGLCQRDICECLAVPKQTMSRVLGRAQEGGLVAQVRSSADSREKIFSLTPEGRLRAQAITGGLCAVEAECLGGERAAMEASNEFNRLYLDRFEAQLDALGRKEKK